MWELTYTLNEDDLPAGLSFDGAARTISGTPPTDATYAESYTLTYRVADVDGDDTVLRFDIRVNGIPSFVREQDDQPYTAGEGGELGVAGGSRRQCGADVSLGRGVACGSVV